MIIISCKPYSILGCTYLHRNTAVVSLYKIPLSLCKAASLTNQLGVQLMKQATLRQLYRCVPTRLCAQCKVDVKRKRRRQNVKSRVRGLIFLSDSSQMRKHFTPLLFSRSFVSPSSLGAFSLLLSFTSQG